MHQQPRTTSRRLRILTEVVAARVPVDVAAIWRAEAINAGLTMSDWLRQSLAADRVPVQRHRPRSTRAADPALLRELARIGNNVNQMAHAINLGAVTGHKQDSLQLLRSLRAIEQQLLALATGAAGRTGGSRSVDGAP